jgi:Family of unknown function (DUF6627)
MKAIRKNRRSLCVCLTILTVLISVPFQAALAALISTETILDTVHTNDARDQLRQFLARQDVKTALINQGVDPEEAQARVSSLTDAEVLKITNQIEKLPAGGEFGFVIGILLIILLVVVIVKLIK